MTAVPTMDAWKRDLIRSLREPVQSPHGDPLPDFPPRALQQSTTGRSGELAIEQAIAFYEDVVTQVEQSGATIRPDWHVLDFGCGWGRIARTALRDVRASNIHGIDVDADFAGISSVLFRSPNFTVCQPFPPSHHTPGAFDLVLAYSVFSHLSEAAASAWISEFARVLKPGGFLAFTSRDEAFLDYCLELAKQYNAHADQYHQNKVATMFKVEEIPAVREAYRNGEFIYCANGGGGVRDASFYGEAFLPAGWLERTHGHQFEIISSAFDGARYDQRCFVLRKR